MCPEVFYQLYTIHAFHSERVIPCVYSLLPDTSEDIYYGLFRQMIQVEENLHPQFLRAMRLVPFVHLRKCFHRLECKDVFITWHSVFLRSVQDNGLAQLYREDEEFSLQVRMIPALAFVPVDDVVDAYEKICDD